MVALRDKPLFLLLLRRLFFFLLFETVCLAFLWTLGNFRRYAADTQFMLLRLTSLSGLAALCYGLYCIVTRNVLGIVTFFRTKKVSIRFHFGTVFYLITGAFCLALAAASAFIVILTKGNMS
jgi:hypothetical protein